MLRSLHTVSSGARHAIQPHLLSIQFLFLRSFVYKTAACQCNPRHNRLSLSIFCECNSFFFLIDLCIKRRQCPTLKKTQCHIPIVERSAGRSQCHPAAAEGAKLSRMRRGNGPALPTKACRISSESLALFGFLYMQ